MSHMLITGGLEMATNKTRRLYARASLAPLLALAMLFWIGTPVSGQTAPAQNPQDNDTTWRELADMDRFLDSHPEMAEQLRKDPSLINNQQWVENHPALQEYLQTHPEIREEFSENPNAFMLREERYERREEGREREHETGLGDDRHIVHALDTHPEVREEFKENPSAFMRREERYDRREDDRDREAGIGLGDDRHRMGDRDARGELTSFGHFLGSHSTVAEQLSRDPSLANNKEFLANHPELGEYLKAHPGMTQQLAANPQAVMSSNWVMQASNTAPKASSVPKGKPNPNR